MHEPYWTATARHADIVLPATTTLERDDIGAGRRDAHLIAMHQAVAPFGEARDDYAILAGLAERLGVGAEFTEGRTAREWVVHLYDVVAPAGRVAGAVVRRVLGAAVASNCRATTSASRCSSSSGRPRRTSAAHAERPDRAVLGDRRRVRLRRLPRPPDVVAVADRPTLDDRHPLVLIANQPTTRLHSQLDAGAVSQASKVPAASPSGSTRSTPRRAASPTATSSACSTTAVRASPARWCRTTLRPGVVQLATGAWFDPGVLADGVAACVHGNPNVLTADVPTSRLAQGCTGQHAAVQLIREAGALPPVRAHEPPTFAHPRLEERT